MKPPVFLTMAMIVNIFCFTKGMHMHTINRLHYQRPDAFQGHGSSFSAGMFVVQRRCRRQLGVGSIGLGSSCVCRIRIASHTPDLCAHSGLWYHEDEQCPQAIQVSFTWLCAVLLYTTVAER